MSLIDYRSFVNYIFIICIISLPYILRFFQVFVPGSIKKIYYNLKNIIPIESGYGPNMETVHTCTWDEARTMHGYSQCKAFMIGTIRFIFWHILQPISYLILLYIYHDALSNAQLILGCIIGIRESIYFSLLLIVLIMKPSFLLVDISADPGWGSFMLSLSLYIFAPDIFVYMILAESKLFKTSTHIWIHRAILIIFIIMNYCAIVALILGIKMKSLPIPLSIGYFFTTLEALCLIIGYCYGFYCNR